MIEPSQPFDFAVLDSDEDQIREAVLSIKTITPAEIQQIAKALQPIIDKLVEVRA